MQADDLRRLRIGYVPYDPSLRPPGDRRRFPFWARRRDVPFDVARPGERYDLVVLSARADITTWALHPVDGTRIVYDLIDSYLALPRRSVGNVLRGAAKFAARETRRLALDYHGAIEAMCRRADAVVCSTPEQADTIRPLNANVHDVLDAHVDVVQAVKDDYAGGHPFRLVWEGLPYTLDDFLPLAPVLRGVASRRPLELHLHTDVTFHKYGGRFVRQDARQIASRILPTAVVHQWDEAGLAAAITRCDLAVVPLDLRDPLARSKPENKLLLFWRMGMPAVVSATPAYRRVMAAAGGPQLVCETPDEWAAVLEEAIADADLRRVAAQAGRRYVEERHAESDTLRRWDDVVASVLG